MKYVVSSICKCSLCSIRNVSKIESEILAGPKFCFMLDIEPIYPHEGELTSSNRLLERVCRDYPKAFEAVTGDAIYLNGTTFGLLASHGKYAAAVLKDKTRDLYDEAISLSFLSTPLVYEKKYNLIGYWITQ